jgi:hypothetical protein
MVVAERQEWLTPNRSTRMHSMCTKTWPAIVTPSSAVLVKSVCAASPGRWSWANVTSLSGPLVARQTRTFRCSVRSWPGS